jgi:hypothetical protein
MLRFFVPAITIFPIPKTGSIGPILSRFFVAEPTQFLASGSVEMQAAKACFQAPNISARHSGGSLKRSPAGPGQAISDFAT